MRELAALPCACARHAIHIHGSAGRNDLVLSIRGKASGEPAHATLFAYRSRVVAVSITIEYEIVEEDCGHCGELYPVARGPVYEETEGKGLYLAGMHRCSEGGSVVMTIALEASNALESFTLQAWGTLDEIQMSFVDGEDSPLAGHTYLGDMLSAEDARRSDIRSLVFEVADLICTTIPEVVTFLDDTARPDPSDDELQR